ncbi:hypothetical protein RYX36_034487 [Vicia faba]
MGISFSSPFKYNDVEDETDSMFVKSIKFGNDETKTPLRSISFKSEDLEPTILKSLGSGKMTIETSVSFKRNDFDSILSTDTLSFDNESNSNMMNTKKSREIDDLSSKIERQEVETIQSALLNPSSPKHIAALKLQKVYKSFRTRRKLADCAILVEQSWYLSKTWLLEFFLYRKLDIGEGREVNLEKCPRFKLQLQCIKYLGPMERFAYEVIVKDGKFFYKQSGELLHTAAEDSHAKWIFVLSTSKSLYVGKKNKGSFQHSSFLAGGATSSAGRLVIENGVLKAVWPHSGHYRPTEENFKEFISFLQENNVNLSDVKMAPVDEDDEFASSRSSCHLRNHSSEDDYIEKINSVEIEGTVVPDLVLKKDGSIETGSEPALVASSARQLQILGRKLTNLEIPIRGEVFEGLENEKEDTVQTYSSFEMEESLTTSQETEESLLSDHSDSTKIFDDDNDNDIEKIPEESILKRINSHKETKSYQLGRQLSCKWTTGAGPRIGCVRDYPSELQFRALEQVNLSPRSGTRTKSSFALRSTTSLNSNISCLGDTATETLLNENQSVSKSEFSPVTRGTSVIPVLSYDL